MGYLLGNVWSGGAPAASDAFSDQMAGLSAGEWSGNLRLGASGTALMSNFVRPTDSGYNEHYNLSATTLPTVNGSGNAMAYSSPAFVRSRDVCIHVGGGHLDWLGSQVSEFDIPTCSWSKTDDTARLDTSPATGAPFNTSGNTDSGGTAWYAAKNVNGRWAPMSSHVYGGDCYLPDAGLVVVFGKPPFPQGSGTVGGSMCVDAATGQWESGDPPAHAVAFTGLGTSCISFALADCLDNSGNNVGERALYVGRSPNSASMAYRYDPGANSWEQCFSQFSSASFTVLAGCVIPDPNNSGKRAYLGWATTNPTTQACLIPKVDVVGIAAVNGTYKAWANTAPSLGANARLIYMGYDRSGSEQVFAFDPANPDEFYLCDVTIGAAWGTWSGPFSLTGTAPDVSLEVSGTHGTFHRLFYHPDRDVLCLFAVKPTGGEPGDFFAFKRPSEVN